MLQTLQLAGNRCKPHEPPELPAGDPAAEGEMAHVPGGPFVMGTEDRAWALDNEREAHEVDVSGFRLDETPVTNSAYLEFVEDGGYVNRDHWDPEGWAWVEVEGITAPKHWYQPEPHSWRTVCFGFDKPPRMDAPVRSFTSLGSRPTLMPGGQAGASRRRRQ